ncbi:MAG: tetratricopeptide repeat protein [Chitinophagales bacterium]|nr:tetratricopeptide repeat protein [Chitinophagales bacterium]
MLEREFDDAYHEDVAELIEHYEKMVKDNANCFFEEASFDQILDYYEQRQNFKKAREVVDLAILQHPFSASFLVRKAQILFESKEFDFALDLLDKAEIFDATDTNIYLLRSDIFVWMGKYQRAVDTIRTAISISEKEELPDLYLELADIYEEWEKFDEVFDCLVRTLDANPANEEALNRIWFCVEFTEKYQESIDFHTKFIDNEPYSYLAWFNLAHAYAGLDLYEKAVESFEFVMAINDNYEYAYKDCGEILFKLGQFEKAAEYFLKASVLSKPYKELYFSIGECYEKIQNYNRARYYFRKATNLDPYFDEAYFKIGLNYEVEERWESALSAYERAYKLDNENPGYTIALANAYRQNNDNGRAIEFYQRAVELQPDDKDNWLDLAYCHFINEQYRDAINTLDLAALNFENGSDICYTRSAFYFAVGNKNEAYLNLERGLLQNYKQHKMLFELAPSMKMDEQVVRIIDQYRKN